MGVERHVTGFGFSAVPATDFPSERSDHVSECRRRTHSTVEITTERRRGLSVASYEGSSLLAIGE